MIDLIFLMGHVSFVYGNKDNGYLSIKNNSVYSTFEKLVEVNLRSYLSPLPSPTPR